MMWCCRLRKRLELIWYGDDRSREGVCEERRAWSGREVGVEVGPAESVGGVEVVDSLAIDMACEYV